MAKIVEVRDFKNDDYKKWLAMTGKDDNKKSMIEYCATVLGQGKECWEMLEQGKITLDNVELAKMPKNILDDIEEDIEKVSDREVQGFKKIFEGIAQIVGMEDTSLLDEVDNKSIRLIFMNVMADYGDDIMNAGKRIVHMCEIYCRAQSLVDFIFGEKKESKEVVQ